VTQVTKDKCRVRYSLETTLEGLGRHGIHSYFGQVQNYS